MCRSLNFGTIAGTAVRAHIAFLLFLGWIFAGDYASGGPDEAWTGLLFMVLLFACVLARRIRPHLYRARYRGVFY